MKSTGDHLWQGWTICGNHSLPYLVGGSPMATKLLSTCSGRPVAAWYHRLAGVSDTIDQRCDKCASISVLWDQLCLYHCHAPPTPGRAQVEICNSCLTNPSPLGAISSCKSPKFCTGIPKLKICPNPGNKLC